MNRPPPLSTDTLKDINARRKDDPEVMALLWEIWRLRRIARKAHQVAISMPRFDETYRLLAEQLERLTKDEPTVIEHRQMIEVLTSRPDKRRV